MKEGKFNIIIGGQAGSESKGKLSGWLCDKEKVDVLFMTSSPNAGHTVVKPNGEKKVSYHLPIGAVMCDCPILLGPASLINLDTFRGEIKALGIDPKRIMVHPRASIITPGHIGKEHAKGMSDIGSTLQGIGEARMGKMRRDGGHMFAGDSDPFVFLRDIGVEVGDTTKGVNNSMTKGATVLCETTQGFDLDLEHGIDSRYCTSKMINPAMAMAEAGVAPSRLGDVYGVVRPYPIRVNNRTGTSGPYADAKEITWGEVARRCGHPSIKPGSDVVPLMEITTTTHLPRRVFEFSWERFLKFCVVCDPTHLCLQFANYIDWEAYGRTSEAELPEKVVQFMEELDYYVPVTHVGTGPKHEDMVEVDRWNR